MIRKPTVDADTYLDEDVAYETDAPEIAAKHGTTVQAGWGAAESKMNKKEDSAYPNDFKFSEELQLVRFLQDEPFAVYEQHWIDAAPKKKSFVCLGAECPLCAIAGDKPRPRFAFNVLNLNGEEAAVQILTAPTMFAKQLQTANSDPRRGPLTKYYWAVARSGKGRDTAYSLDRVKISDLAEDWMLDSEEIDAFAETAVSYDATAIYVSPREELLELARSLVN